MAGPSCCPFCGEMPFVPRSNLIPASARFEGGNLDHICANCLRDWREATPEQLEKSAVDIVNETKNNVEETENGGSSVFSYERHYGTARSVFSVLEIVGWITVCFGLIMALIAFATGGFISAFLGEATAGMRIISMVPGLLIALGGLFSVAFVQSSRANVDNAEMTRELLRIARRD